jgi:hypothetical protein
MEPLFWPKALLLHKFHTMEGQIPLGIGIEEIIENNISWMELDVMDDIWFRGKNLDPKYG